MLTLFGQLRRMDLGRFLTALALIGIVGVLPACSDGPVVDPAPEIGSIDPVLARALNDPLMSDPDLAYRNEANAAVTLRHDHPLPPLVATDELSELAGNVARVELLEGGAIPELPLPESGVVADLSAARTAGEMIDILNGPAVCAEKLSDGLEWAARMPGPSRIMPHGMVQQAAGVENAQCSVRIVRYLTAASGEDVMQYHFTLAERARLRPAVFANLERAIVGSGRIEQLTVHVREGPGGLSAVDVIYWKK